MDNIERKYLCVQVGRRRGRLIPQFSQDPEDLVKERLRQLGVMCLMLQETDKTYMWQRTGVLTFDVAGEVDSGWDKKILTLI